MKVQTKWFGEIEVSDDKIITFDKGIIGFEDWKKYTLVYDAEKEENIFLSLSEMIYRMIISECTARLRYHRILLR